MREALIVGIDYYAHLKPLRGCVNDAWAVHSKLERNEDGSINFLTPRLLAGTNATDLITRELLKSAVQELFSDDSDVALLYFAGHGHIEDSWGYLCAGDSKTGDDGFSLAEIMVLANKSKAKNKIIILDSCYSGVAGNPADGDGGAQLKEGTTILTASTKDQEL